MIKQRCHVRDEIKTRHHVRDEIFKIAKIFILKIISNVHFCPLVVIGDDGACAWLFIESRADAREPSTHPTNMKQKRNEEELRPSKPAGLRFSSLLLFSQPRFIITDKCLFVDPVRINFDTFFIECRQNVSPQLPIFPFQRIHHRTTKFFTKIRVFYNTHPLACFALVFLHFYNHPDHSPFIYPNRRIKIQPIASFTTLPNAYILPPKPLKRTP